MLLEQVPNAQVVMFEAGPQVTEVPGESVRNIADPGEKARAREMSQGPQAGAYRESLGIPAATVTEGMFTARQGTHLWTSAAQAPPTPRVFRGGCGHQRGRPGCALDLRDAVARLQ